MRLTYHQWSPRSSDDGAFDPGRAAARADACGARAHRRRVGKGRGRRAAAAASAPPRARRARKRASGAVPCSPEGRRRFDMPRETRSRTARAPRLQRRRRRRPRDARSTAPVRLSSITVEGGAVSLPDRPLVACEFAAALADYVRLIVAPLGQAMLHAKVAEIETGPGYTCRTQDHIAGAKISAHAKGLAVDFVSITLADKRRVRGREADGRGRSVLLPRHTDGRLRLVHDRSRSGRRRLPRQQHASRYRTARRKRELSHLPVAQAYCATPLPNDQFSFLTSTSTIKTSSRRRLSVAASPSAIAL